MFEEVMLVFLSGGAVGWFLRSAFGWRRAARLLARSHEPPPPPPAPAVVQKPVAETRLEALVERMDRRLEAIEDRLEFTERILDTRAKGARTDAAARSLTAGPHEAGESAPKLSP